VNGLCVYSLRATAATNGLSHEADIAKVQEWLGHANVSTTRLYDRRKTRPKDRSDVSSQVLIKCAMSIHEKIRAFLGTMAEHDSYRSWERCYRYFQCFHRLTPVDRDRDHGALQLGFYLASWGMYRKGFLRDYAYTVHLRVIDQLVLRKFDSLWNEDFGACDSHATTLAPMILEATKAVRDAYKPFARIKAVRDLDNPSDRYNVVSDILVTKVILGTFGCLPACDEYFKYGWKKAGYSDPGLNLKFIKQVLDYCQMNLAEFRDEQARIEHEQGVHYHL
jgi:hypothetical protein